MSVSISIGSQPYPWKDASVHPPLGKAVLVLFVSTKGVPRLRLRSGVWEHQWKVHITTVSVLKGAKVVLWHPNGPPVDVDRIIKAIHWNEKHAGVMKVKNKGAWLDLLRETWVTQPWA